MPPGFGATYSHPSLEPEQILPLFSSFTSFPATHRLLDSSLWPLCLTPSWGATCLGAVGGGVGIRQGSLSLRHWCRSRCRPATAPRSPPRGVPASLQGGNDLGPGGDTTTLLPRDQNEPRNSDAAISPCLCPSFSLHSFRNCRQQPCIFFRSLLSTGSRFCKGGVPGTAAAPAGVWRDGEKTVVSSAA